MWFSTAAFTGSRDTVKQSTVTSEGILSLSLCACFKILKLSSQSLTSSKLSSTNSSRSTVPRATQSCSFLRSSESREKSTSARSYSFPSAALLVYVMGWKKPAFSEDGPTPFRTCGMETKLLMAL